MIITIAKILPIPADTDLEDYFLECYTLDYKPVLFWGSAEHGSRNIDSIRHQSLPVSIELLDPELCHASQHDEDHRMCWTSKRKARYSITELARVIVLSELD